MLRHRFTPLLVVALVLLTLAGCSQRMLDFTVISSKNVTMKLDASGKGPRCEGTDYVWWVLTIPLGTPHLKQAVDRAIEGAGPDYDALIDGVLYAQNYWYVITGKSGYKIVGTPVNTRKLIAELESKGLDPEKYMGNVLYHSSTGRDNAHALQMLPVREVKDLNAVGATAQNDAGAAASQRLAPNR